MATGVGAPVELRNISRKYGHFDAVKNVNLTIAAGEFMTFLGPSGSGKTTTLNLIAGFSEVSSGEIAIGGTQMHRTPPYRRNLGVVFQSYALFPHMTVAQNISFPLEQKNIPRAQRQDLVREAIQLVELQGMESRIPSQLSGGQQQRAALARALVFKPNVLLLDEPLGALDKKLREALQDELKRIHNNVRSTFIFVTHDQEEALALSDRIAIFNRGTIEQVGTGQQLYETPETLFVGRFLGDSNTLRGERLADGSQTSVLSFKGNQLVTPFTPDKSRNILLLRPEKMRLQPRTEHFLAPGDNKLAATVTTITYLGSSWKYDVILDDGTPVIVRQHAESNIHQPGDAVDVVWAHSTGVLLNDAD
ncbi:ABC transporter ATP-binding protein (plasmid) [Brucella anthropi]|nr:ABC transporter ATP-binding protein [Brucella anthropi]